MAGEKQKKAFISYSRVNKDFATKLAKGLRSEGYDIWFDLMDIPPGARWDDYVESALQECPIFMIILTPASIASENVKDEIGYAIDHGKRILPILLEECDVPLRLRRFQYVDFTTKSFDQGYENAKELLNDHLVSDSTPIIKAKPEVKEVKAETKKEPANKEKSEAIAAPPTSKKKAEPVVIEKTEKKPVSKGLIFGIIAIVAVVIVGIIVVFGIGTAAVVANNNANNQPAKNSAPNTNSVVDAPATEAQTVDNSAPAEAACPQDYSQPINVYIDNQSGLSLDFYWYSDTCDLIYMGSVDSGQSTSLDTYVNQYFQFIDIQGGSLYYEYYVDSSGSLYFGAPATEVAAIQQATLYLSKNAYCRVFPEASAGDVTAFYSGDSFPIVGQDQDGWWLVKINVSPDVSSRGACWIFAEGHGVDGDTSSVPYMDDFEVPRNYVP